tara:strand:- start:4506 stop:5006 length:501 start_codon:yes stop_codon:yes gene_type:complete
MAISVSIEGLDKLQITNEQMGLWAKKPFSGKAALRIKEIFAKENNKAFNSKGRSIGEKWKPLSLGYKAWKSKRFPNRPLLVLRGNLKASLTKTNSRLMIFNNRGGKKLILGTRVPYANAQNYGSRRRNLPKRRFVKITQKTADAWANEMRKDVEVAMTGSKRWQGR